MKYTLTLENQEGKKDCSQLLSQLPSTNAEVLEAQTEGKHVREDGIYTLKVWAKDEAGNIQESLKDHTFSINRKGSTFRVLSGGNGQSKALSKAPKLLIKEINVDPIQDEKILVYKDGMPTLLKENSDYKRRIKVLKNGYSHVLYTIGKENFQDTGPYRVVINSQDKAKNTSSTIHKIPEGDLEFYIDKIPPSIFVSGVEKNQTYLKKAQEIQIYAKDNHQLTEIKAYYGPENNQKMLKKLCKQDIFAGMKNEKLFNSESNSQIRFTLSLPENKVWSNTLKVVGKDEAGLLETVEIKGIRVTRNRWESAFFRYSIICVVSMLILLILFVILINKVRGLRQKANDIAKNSY